MQKNAAPLAVAEVPTTNGFRPMTYFLLSGSRYLCRLWSGTRHRGYAARCRSRCTRGRLRGGGRQAQVLAYFRIQLGIGVAIVFQELAGILATLADAFVFIAEPGPGFLQQ